MNEAIPIQSHDYWFKVVDMLQQNWALIDTMDEGVVAFFVSDSSGIFDQITFPSATDAESALRLNGFRRLCEDPGAASILRRPVPPFHRRPHPNGPIYSSGRFWKV
jgi:cation diffusion facilitator CzcD-associated flavoprotein CzcO